MKLLQVIVLAIVGLTIFTVAYYTTNNAVYTFIVTMNNSIGLSDASLNDTMYTKFNQILGQWSYLPIYYIVLVIIMVFIGAMAYEYYDKPERVTG